jgi:hypothetical protein
MAEIEVRRGPRARDKTLRKMLPVPSAAPVIEAGNGLYQFDYRKEGVSLTFELPAGGQGDSLILAWVKPGAFAELAQAMVAASPKRAETAFLAAMLNRRKPRAKRS